MTASFSIKSKQRRMKMFNFRIKAGSIQLDVLGNTTNFNVSANSILSALHGLSTGDRILFTEDSSPVALSISDSGVTNASNLFTSTDHGLLTGDKILVTEDNTLPSGLTTATNYWVVKIDDDNFKLASSYANAVAETPVIVSISDDGSGANSYDAVPAPTNLTTATQYWVIKVDANNYKLATTYANAIAGTAVDLTDHGAGTNEYDLVEEQAGLDVNQLSGNVQATAVGTYKFNLPAGTFFDANAYEVHVMPHARDIVCNEDRSARTATSFTIKVDAIDETAALVDGMFAVLIVGSEIEDRY